MAVYIHTTTTGFSRAGQNIVAPDLCPRGRVTLGDEELHGCSWRDQLDLVGNDYSLRDLNCVSVLREKQSLQNVELQLDM